MSDELFKRVALYHSTMALVRSMLTQGIITDVEYAKIDEEFAAKYKLSGSVIYR